MYKVTVIDIDREEHEYESIQDYIATSGALQIYHTDGSITLYAAGAWLEADVQRVDNPQAPPLIEDGNVYGEQL